MNQKITEALVRYFKSDQWEELMRQLTQTEEELYHTYMYSENNISGESLCRLFEAYFNRKGIPLDRKIDLLTSVCCQAVPRYCGAN